MGPNDQILLVSQYKQLRICVCGPNLLGVFTGPNYSLCGIISSIYIFSSESGPLLDLGEEQVTFPAMERI